MGTTVIVIDTNMFYRQPLLKSDVWPELISKADEWDLHLAIPRVVEQEAFSVVSRKWQKVRDGLAKPTLVAEMGLAETRRTLLDEIERRSLDTPTEALRDRLEEIFAEVVPIPEFVNILEIAHRAIDERAPYSTGTKDGLRDTLIWHTVREVAKRDPECEVWFVSDNYRDFGASDTDSEACPDPLHPQLADELEAEQPSERIRYVRSSGRLMQHLARRYDPLPDAERDELIAQVDREAWTTITIGTLCIAQGIIGLFLPRLAMVLTGTTPPTPAALGVGTVLVVFGFRMLAASTPPLTPRPLAAVERGGIVIVAAVTVLALP